MGVELSPNLKFPSALSNARLFETRIAPGLLFQVKPFLPLANAIERVTTWATAMSSPPSLKPLRSPLSELVPSVSLPLWWATHWSMVTGPIAPVSSLV